MRVGICDDDALWSRKAEKIICRYAEQTETQMEVICFTAPEELEHYEGYPLDVLFMDIVLEDETGEKNGIDLVTTVNAKWNDCQIVYLTNYLFYATEVYHTEHVFFALKEQFEERVVEIFGKVLHQLSQTREKLVFSVIGGKEVSLAPADIFCFERNGRTTDIITMYGTYPVWDKLSALIERLPEPDFVRCHNSYIVYLPAVREMLADAFIMDDGRKVMISRSYRKKARAAFMKWAVTQIS